MVTDSLPIASVEERARDIVLALDGTAYKQGPADPKWRETRSLRIRDEAASVVHLRFHAAVDSAQSNGGHRGSPRGTEQVESELIVAFVYHLRPATHAEDLRLSNSAAQDIAKAINRDTSADWSPRFVGISTDVDTERGLARKIVAFSVVHNIEV